MKLITADAIAPTPWKNGGGQTRELFAWPPRGDWRLRISLADIERDGPFSAFPGVQRHFAVLEGDGVRLQLAAGPRELRAGEAPIAFDGAEAPGCCLLGGSTRDLNLMRRDGLAAEMRRAAEGEPWDAPWSWRALFVVGPARLDGQVISPFSLVTGLPPGPLRLQCTGPAYWIGADLA